MRLTLSLLLIALVALTAPAGLPLLEGVIDLAQGEEDIRILGNDPNGRLGAALAVGDLNGDGFEDIAMGAPETDQDDGGTPQAGEVVVILGEASLNPVIDLSVGVLPGDQHVLGGEAFSDFGAAVAIGDFNGDGFEDLAIGAPEDDGDAQSGLRTGAGAVFIVFGQESLARSVNTANNAQDVRIIGAANLDGVGFSLAAGDLNADGIDELVVGIPDRDHPDSSRTNMGEVAILHGRESWPSRIDMDSFQTNLTVIRGDDNGDRLGTDVALGDVNGDGFLDLIAGAIEGDNGNSANTGEVVIVTGRANLPNLIDLMDAGVGTRLLGDDSGDLLGDSVATGDVDSDGRADLLMGAPGGDGFQSAATEEDAGEGALWRGRSALPDDVDFNVLEEDLRIYGGDAEDFLGTDLVAIDLNGDGRDEWVISRPLADPASLQAGEILVFTAGRLQGFTDIDLDDTNADLVVAGDRPNDEWGTALAAGDIDRDGFPDLIMGAPEADPGPSDMRRFQAGQVAIVLGGGAGTTAERRRHDRADDAPRGDFGPVVRAAVDFDAGDAASATDAAITREEPEGFPPGAAAVVRWMITTDRTGHTQADVTLRYTDSEIMGLTEEALTVFSAASATGPWSALPTTIDARRNAATATVSAAGLAAQSHFAIATGAGSADVIAFLLGLTTTPPAGADANGDGRVDVADVVFLVNRGR